jgi:hypothetical protein
MVCPWEGYKKKYENNFFNILKVTEERDSDPGFGSGSVSISTRIPETEIISSRLIISCQCSMGMGRNLMLHQGCGSGSESICTYPWSFETLDTNPVVMALKF